MCVCVCVFWFIFLVVFRVILLFKFKILLLCGFFCFFTRILGRKEGNIYLMTHSTHFIYGYMASDIW